MWRDRFVELVRERLATSGHPDIVGVEYYDIDASVKDLRIKCSDGRTIALNIVRTSPPGGDNYNQAENIVTK
jgi:hypothetical protein